MPWVLDLDGVVWRGDARIPGAAHAVARLQATDEQVWFVTNNSSKRISEQEAKLARHGIDATGRVLTSAIVAADLVEPGERALVCGGDGIIEALSARGVDVVRDGAADVVVVGWHRDFDFDRLSAAMLAVRGGARLLGTNDDSTYPTADGLLPGGGSILAAVAYASGVDPQVAGKPYDPIVEWIRTRLGTSGTVVGDRPDTDGLLARRLGYRWGLVLSGVTTTEDLPVDPDPDVVGADLAALVDRVL